MESTPNITKAERVLRYIATNPDGRTMKEIQTFILDMNGRQKWLDKGYLRYHPTTGQLERTHAGRGYWTDYLYGLTSMLVRPGLLRRFCTRLPTGRWKVTEEIKGPWRSMPVKTKSWFANNDRDSGAQQRHLAGLPKCPNCKRPMNQYSELTPDKQAHLTSMSMDHVEDCKDRVWRTNNCMVSYRGSALKLTTFTKSEVHAAEHMAQDMFKNDWTGAKKAVWNMLGTRLA